MKTGIALSLLLLLPAAARAGGRPPEAAQAPAKPGPADKDNVAALAAALKSEEAALRHGALMALWRLGPAAADAVPALTEILGDKKSWVRDGAACVLGAIGPAAKPAIPALVRSREGHAGLISHEEYIQILELIGPAGKAALPALIAELESGRKDTPLAALPALEIMGPAAAEAVPAIIRRLAAEHWLSGPASSALKKIGAAALPRLAELLNRGEFPASPRAAEELSDMGPRGQAALMDALKSKDDFVVMSAARALGMMIKPPRSALPALKKLQKHDSPFVRIRAKAAADHITSPADN